MKKDYKRTDRIAQSILRSLAQLIQLEISDPRFKGLITLSDATVTNDLKYAKIYFTVLNDDPDLALEILTAAASYLRTHLAKTMKLRTVPQLRFIYDESIEYGKNLSRLIDDVNPKDSDEQDD
jgi:ribosome-binding factor A